MADKKPGFFEQVKESQVWKSVFRHGYADTPRNRILQVSSNVFLHLHPSKLPRHAVRIRFTWCAGGVTFLFYLITVVTGVILMQVLPFADDNCLEAFAGFESGVYAGLDAAQQAA